MVASGTLEGQPLDVLSWQTAWDTLSHRAVASDDEMHDYSISQAYRSVAHAFASRPPPADHQLSTASSSGAHQSHVAAGHGVLRVLSLGCIQTAALRATAVFVLVKLLVEEGSAHGESNRIPEVSSRMPEWIASHGEQRLSRSGRSIGSSTGIAEQRRHSMGFAVLLREGLACLSTTLKRQSTFICSVSAELVRALVSHVMPLLSSLGEGLDDHMNRQVEVHHDRQESVPLPPTYRTMECNTAVLVIAHLCLEDLVAADTASATPAKDGQKKRPVVVDTSLGPLMWDAERAFTAALLRHDRWLRDSALRAKHTFRTSLLAKAQSIDTIDEETTANLLFTDSERWSLGDLTKMWAVDISDPLRRQYQELDAALLATRRAYGGADTKDAASIISAQWGLTMRLCVLTTSIAKGVVDPVLHPQSSDAFEEGHSTAIDAQAHRNQEVVKGLVSQLVHHVVQLEGAESPHQALVARLTLLSIASKVFFAYPMEAQQEQLWASACGGSVGAQQNKNVTEMFHQALLMRPLHYRDAVVVRLATLVSSSILHSVAGSARFNALDIGGEELLELMRSGRDDGASRGAVQMVAMACMTRPHAMVPSLFRLLEDRSNKAARDNALDVLDCLPRLLSASSYTAESTLEQPDAFVDDHQRADANDGTAKRVNLLTNRAKRVRQSQRDRLEEVIRILGNHLLLSLGSDEELHHRQHAASLFAMMDPVDVVRPLVVMQLKRDVNGKRRDAASKALAAVLQSGGLRKRRSGAEHPLLRRSAPQLSGVVELLHTCRTMIASKLAVELSDVTLPLQTSTAEATIEGTPSELHTATSSALDRERRAPTTPADIFMLSELGQLTDATSSAQEDAPSSIETADAASPQTSAMLSKRLLQLVSTTIQQWATSLLSHNGSNSSAPGHENSGDADTVLVNFIACTFAKGDESCIAEEGDTIHNVGKHVDKATQEVARQLSIRASTSAIVGAFSSTMTPERALRLSSEICRYLSSFVLPLLLSLDADSPHKNGGSFDSATYHALYLLLCIKAFPAPMLQTCNEADVTDHDATLDGVAAIPRILLKLLGSLGNVLAAAGAQTVDAVRRVLLEVMCKLPPAAILPRLRHEASLLVRMCAGSIPPRDEAADTMTASAVAYRAYLFVLQQQTVFTTKLLLFGDHVAVSGDDVRDGSIGERSGDASRQDRGAQCLHDEFDGCLLPMVTSVLEWCLTSSASNQGRWRQSLGEENCTKLWMGSVDAFAVMFVIHLRRQRSASDEPNGAAWHNVWAAVLSPMSRPPSELVEMLIDPHNTVVEESSSSQPLSPSLSVVSRAAWLTILQASVKIVVQQEAVAQGWIRCWAREVLPRIIHAANAIVAAASRNELPGSMGSPTVWVMAVRRLIAPLFALIVLRPARLEPTTPGKEEDRHVVLDGEDEAALLDFACGCLAYEAQPLVQFEGIKLASACIGRLPQSALFEAQPHQQHGTSGPIGGIGAPLGSVGGITKFDAMLARLSRMAMMHPLAEARQLAEQVVGMLTTSSAT